MPEAQDEHLRSHDVASSIQSTVSASPSDSATAKSTPRLNTTALWLRRSDQLFVFLMVTTITVLLGIQWLRLSRWGSVPVEVKSQKPREYHYSLDINTASWVEWAQLEGIGEKLAKRIVADRNERGPFQNPTDVGRVRGIGPKTIERIKPFLRGGKDVSSESKP